MTPEEREDAILALPRSYQMAALLMLAERAPAEADEVLAALAATGPAAGDNGPGAPRVKPS